LVLNGTVSYSATIRPQYSGNQTITTYPNFSIYKNSISESNYIGPITGQFTSGGGYIASSTTTVTFSLDMSNYEVYNPNSLTLSYGDKLVIGFNYNSSGFSSTLGGTVDYIGNQSGTYTFGNGSYIIPSTVTGSTYKR
jgi:hypothetical protein